MTSACGGSLHSCTGSTPMLTGRRRSCDTVCSSNSSCFLQKKKTVNPLAVSVRTMRGRTEQSNGVRQRVMSAKLIKLRNLQSQLNDANFHLMELAKENRALKTLQKRQDKALNNYEGINADLPRLLKAHEEENRTLGEKNKALRRLARELQEQLKIKDEELMTSRDQLKHLMNISKDKHLGEREKLREQLEESRTLVKNYETEIGLLNRKLVLELKNSKYKLNAEVTKNRQSQKELAAALTELSRFSEGRDKPKPQRFGGNRQSLSMVCLTNNSCSSVAVSPDEISESREDGLSETSSETKLEPIKRKDSTEAFNTMQSPVEKIKARLSANGNRKVHINDVADILNKLTVDEEMIKKTFTENKLPVKLETISTPVTPPKVISNSIELEPPEEIVEEPTNTDKSSNLLLTNDDFDLVNKIWNEEYAFRKSAEKDANGNETRRDPAVALQEKKKLLAKLRDIDNGKSVDSGVDDIVVSNGIDRKKSTLIKELFG